MYLPTWMYHADHDPKLFHTEAAVKDAELKGWVDTPAKIIKVEKEQDDNATNNEAADPKDAEIAALKEKLAAAEAVKSSSQEADVEDEEEVVEDGGDGEGEGHFEDVTEDDTSDNTPPRAPAVDVKDLTNKQMILDHLKNRFGVVPEPDEKGKLPTNGKLKAMIIDLESKESQGPNF